MSRRVVVVHFNPPNLDKRLANSPGSTSRRSFRRCRPRCGLCGSGRRTVPLVFAGGEEAQVARVRNLLPDATYVTWADVPGVLAWAKPLAKPVVPGTMDAYSQTQLEPKLGVREATTMLLLGAPDGFGKALRRAELLDAGPAQIVMLCVPDAAALTAQFAGAKAAIAPGGTLWICWPKKTSGLQSDLSEREVRGYALDGGLVDFKIAAIDQTWSGLRFARKKPSR